MLSLKQDNFWMEQALLVAQKALPLDVPVGAIVINAKGEKLSEAYNQRELLQKPSAHAEILALDEAAKALNNWRLSGCVLYVTLEPCSMCASLIMQSRISRVVFGAYDLDGLRSGLNEGYPGGLKVNKKTSETENLQVHGGILEDKCGELLKNFFRNKRK